MTCPQVVALFVKSPIPGRVKTRLGRDIGYEAACSIYRNLADHVVQQIQVSGFPLALFFDGDDPGLLPDAWKRSARFCVKQQGADLGERMAAAFSRLFADGAEQVLLVGSDIHGLDAAYLQQAFQLFAEKRLVIGPALDGGYCLVGLQRESFTPLLFENIPWSTNRVLALTLQNAAAAGLSTALLPALRDVDTIEDLRCCSLPPV